MVLATGLCALEWLSAGLVSRSLGRRAGLFIATLVTFIACWGMFGSLVFWVFRATGNWDSEGADIALYPAGVTLVATTVATFQIRLVLVGKFSGD